MNAENIIQCTDVKKDYGNFRVLDIMSLKVGTGRIVGLLGPNGSGKTTLIKLLNGLITPDEGSILVDGEKVGYYSKSIVSYLPDRTYFADWMKVKDIFDVFSDFYIDFDRKKAIDMCLSLGINESHIIRTMSKGTKEKVQLILCMSRNAKLYLLDEPIAGVDPAAREFILKTIINNYGEDGTVLMSTHLISEIERILDEVVFIYHGKIVRHDSVDIIRSKTGKSIDELFREEYRMGGVYDV